jgi:hypothetical protein
MSIYEAPYNKYLVVTDDSGEFEEGAVGYKAFILGYPFFVMCSGCNPQVIEITHDIRVRLIEGDFEIAINQ